MYLFVKHTHMTLVLLSVSFFVVRFLLLQRNAPVMQQKWIKVVPHVIDTVLLLSAITLCFLLKQYPFVTPWVTEKVIGLLAYIVLGMVAMKLGKTPQIRWVAFIGALAWVAFLVQVATTKQPLLLL